MKNFMLEGNIKIKLKNLFFSRVGTLFVMSEDSLTIEYNERAPRSIPFEFVGYQRVPYIL